MVAPITPPRVTGWVKWGPEQVRKLKKLTANREGGRLDWEALRREFPAATERSIRGAIRRYGMEQSPAWTPREDQTIRTLWGTVSTGELESALPGRSSDRITERAKALGLPARYASLRSIRSLADDPAWGYDYYQTLRLLEFAGVEVLYLRLYATGERTGGVPHVPLLEAQEAAARWAATESPTRAALRLRVRKTRLRAWLELEGLVPAGRSPTYFRADPATYDSLASRYGSLKESELSARLAAARPIAVERELEEGERAWGRAGAEALRLAQEEQEQIG